MKPSILSVFNSNGRPSAEFLSIINDEGLTNKYKTLKEYCTSENIEINSKDVIRLKKHIEDNLAEQCLRHAYVLYRLFDMSGNWNDGPDHQVKLSFGKIILKLSNSEPFTFDHLMAFENKIQEAYIEHNLLSKTESALQLEFDNWKPRVLGKIYPIQKNKQLNQLLEFIGSKYSIYLKKYKKGIGILWGYSKQKRIGIYNISRFTEELIRTPNFPISNAASVLENHIITRHESMYSVFHQKWAPLILKEQEDWRTQSDPYWNISYGIRQYTLQLYDYQDPSDLQKIETALVQEMEEAIIYHEIGHTVIREIFLPIENIGIGLGAKHYNCYFYDGIYELLADFAPKHKLGHGAMAQLVKISQTDRKKAERMFYSYLSDVWFFDTEDRFMFDYASMVVLCMLRYINGDKSVNFDAIAKDITYQANRTKKEQLTMIERVQELFMWDTDEIGSIAKNATFKIGNETLSFQQVYKDRLTQAKKLYPSIDPDGYDFLQPFWTNMYSFLHHFTEEEAKVKKLLDQSVKKNLMKLLVLSCGRAKADSYKFDHMQYIVDRFFELGIAYYPNNSRKIIS